MEVERTEMATTARRLGSSELEVGPLAYGCWRFAGTGVPEAQGKIEAALACGMTLVDTADIYGFGDGPGFGAAESLLGSVLAAAPGLRDGMVLATKGGIEPGVPYQSGGDHLRLACEASLRRLGVEVIDLYQVHRPDLLAHPAEVAAALDGLVAAGKVRALGVSNHTPAQLAALHAHLDSPLATVQPELSLLHLDPIDDGVLDAAMQHGLTPLAWSPLAGGRLVADGAPPALLGTLESLAEREGVTVSAIALAFVLAHPSGAIPIIGTQRPERIREAASATTIALTKADCYALLAATGRALP